MAKVFSSEFMTELSFFSSSLYCSSMTKDLEASESLVRGLILRLLFFRL